MAYVLVRHKVEDFAKWKAGYDDHAGVRKDAGLTEVHLLRNIDSPNEVVILFAAEEVEKARAFAASQDLQEIMQNVGVVDKPDIYFLN